MKERNNEVKKKPTGEKERRKEKTNLLSLLITFYCWFFPGVIAQLSIHSTECMKLRHNFGNVEILVYHHFLYE
jgi:hypothetical protein